MRNVLIQLIDAGRVQTLEELKSAYRKVTLKTHPDAVGSDRYLESYLELSGHYREAKAYLARSQPAGTGPDESEIRNHRLAFFRQLHLIESMEMPYAFHQEENGEKLRVAKTAAMNELVIWKEELAGLYREADKEYAGIKREKPMGPYLKHALALNVRPLLHNLIGYHLTGRELYAKQARQNLSGIMHKLSEKGCVSLREFLEFLLEDMKNGPAVLE